MMIVKQKCDQCRRNSWWYLESKLIPAVHQAHTPNDAKNNKREEGRAEKEEEVVVDEE